MTFVEECVRDSLPIWQECLDTPFLRGLADGTLAEDCFLGYIVEDSLYLREYAKVFAWGILHAKSMSEVRTYYSLLSYVNESEDATRLKYLEKYGLTDDEVQALPLRPENQAYVDAMIEAARQGEGAAECLMACLPCMLSYIWIFEKLVEAHPGALDTVFGPLVREYVSKEYGDVCRQWAVFADGVCEGMDEARKARCREVFRACSQHEYNFWRMCEKPRDDIRRV
ncbi:MAG: TENA/THI-4 family protein [Candidatus Spyradocola sp.]|nr:TENA/THI-4 family protein [Candidatus Spyradocola sp.]